MANHRNRTLADPPRWMTRPPFITFPIFFIFSDRALNLSNSAFRVYFMMRASYRNGDPGCNTDITRIKFGPADMHGIIYKKTYYRAINELLENKFIELVEPGMRGKKAIYNLRIIDWIE